MHCIPTWLFVMIFQAKLTSVVNSDGALYHLMMEEDDALMMPRSARLSDQMAHLAPTDTSKTSRASLFLPGTGIFGSSQPARTILVTPAASSGPLTTAACCPCTGVASGPLIAPVSPVSGRLTATGGFGWPNEFSGGFTNLPAVSTFPAASGQLIAPYYLSSSQQQQQQIPQASQQQFHQEQNRLAFSSDGAQVESLTRGKNKNRFSRGQIG